MESDPNRLEKGPESWSSGGAPSGRVLSGKFRVRELLGAGGMGAVYVAEHTLTRRLGALKLLHSSFAKLPDALERFLREASAAGLIGSPHIVETHDAGTLESGEPYIFMELLAGHGLDVLIRRDGPASLETAVDITMQAAHGLQAAHQAGIVHRDVKPANLFVLEGPRPFVKLLDFGISKFAPEAEDVRSDLTRDGALLGTPVYMSPEQVMGRRDLDGRTDVFSLGVVLYELLTGEMPFQGDSLMQLSANICQGIYTRPSELRSDLPAELERILETALHRDRERRFASAEAFASALAPLFPEWTEPDPALGRRGSGRPQGVSVRVGERSASGPARSQNPTFVEAPTLEPHSTTERTGGSMRAPRIVPLRVLGIGAGVLLAVGVGFVLLVPDVDPEAADPTASGASATAAAGLPSAERRGEPVEAPVEVASATPSSHTEAAVATAAAPSTPPSVRPAKTKPGDAPATSSARPSGSAKAVQDGLSVENPFREP